MNRRAQRRREMEGLLSQRESKGLSLRTLSDRSGIPVGTLSWWSHKLRSEEATESVPTFVELVTSESPRFTAAVPDTEPCEPELRVQHPSGLVLEFRGALATNVAERVLNGIGQWS